MSTCPRVHLCPPGRPLGGLDNQDQHGSSMPEHKRKLHLTLVTPPPPTVRILAINAACCTAIAVLDDDGKVLTVHHEEDHAPDILGIERAGSTMNVMSRIKRNFSDGAVRHHKTVDRLYREEQARQLDHDQQLHDGLRAYLAAAPPTPQEEHHADH